MRTGDFPSTTSQTLGQFWVPSSEDSTVPGILEIDGPDVQLQVSPELTPMFTIEKTGPGSSTVKIVDEPDDMAILGSIPLRPLKVTLWDAYTAAHNQIGGPFLAQRGRGTSRQTLRATWCVVGNHLPDPNTPLYGARPEVTNLTEWAQISPLSITVHPGDNLKLDWHMNLRNKSQDVELPNGAGYLTLSPSAVTNRPNLRGLHVTTTCQLEIELIHGWSLRDITVRVAQPLADLMTLLSGKPCVTRSLDVWADTWCSVHGYQIDPSGAESAGELFFTRPQVHPEFLPRWLELHHRLTPVPQILAAVVRNEFPTVEADALSLATAVESLHRALEPGARRFTSEHINESLSAIEESTMPKNVAHAVSTALRQYLYEYSYPQRVSVAMRKSPSVASRKYPLVAR
ncbi:MAG: hypothetical protein WBB07_27505 [Mycobacterium sp.]